MRSRMKDERGFTLIELLVASSLMIVVLSATLSLLDGIWSNTSKNVAQNDQIETLRNTSDQIMRQIRNLANPNPAACGTPPSGYTICPTIDTATANDFIFQTTDPQKQWVRYCLSNSTGSSGVPSSDTNGAIWYQVATNSVASVSPAMRTDCPSVSASWASRKVVGGNISNAAHSSRPLFSYDQPSSNPTYLTAIRRVKLSMYVDLDPNAAPAEAQIASEAYMRNQNQPPVANFDMLAGASTTAFTLDASLSTDPEGRNLTYDWYRTSSNPTSGQIPADPNSLPNCRLNPTGTLVVPPTTGLTWTCVGNGIVLPHNFSGEGNPNIWLRVVDPGGLPDLSKLPSSGVCPNRTSPDRTDNQCETF